MKLYKVVGCVQTGKIHLFESEIVKETNKRIRTKNKTHRKSNLGVMRPNVLIDSFEIVYTDESKHSEYELMIRAKLLGIIDRRLLFLNKMRNKLLTNQKET